MNPNMQLAILDLDRRRSKYVVVGPEPIQTCGCWPQTFTSTWMSEMCLFVSSY